MIQIKTVQAGFPAQSATQISIRPIIDSTTATSCTTYWQLFSADSKELANGNTPITVAEYLLWDETNTTLENIVLAKLGLERK